MPLQQSCNVLPGLNYTDSVVGVLSVPHGSEHMLITLVSLTW